MAHPTQIPVERLLECTRLPQARRACGASVTGCSVSFTQLGHSRAWKRDRVAPYMITELGAAEGDRLCCAAGSVMAGERLLALWERG